MNDELNRLAEVAGLALDETRANFAAHFSTLWANQDVRDAVNLALGMYTGIIFRRLDGRPDSVEPLA
jgi:hypothetical protein